MVDYVGIYKAPSLALRRKAKRAYANLKDTNPSVSNSTTKPATKTDDTWKLVSNEIKTAWDNLKGAWDFGKGQQTNHSRLLVAQCFSFGVPVSSVAKQLQEQQSIVKGLDWDGKKDADYNALYMAVYRIHHSWKEGKLDPEQILLQDDGTFMHRKSVSNKRGQFQKSATHIVTEKGFIVHFGFHGES